jgi:hypothetical protein
VGKDPEILRRAVDTAGNTLLHMAAKEGKKMILKECLRRQVLRLD